MIGYNYGLVGAGEWLDPESDLNAMLQDSKAEIIRASGYRGNSMFFVLAYFPFEYTWLDLESMNWHEAPHAEKTMPADVLSNEDLTSGAVSPTLEAAEKIANEAETALDKASKIGFGLGAAIFLPMLAYAAWQLVSTLKKDK